MGCYVTCCVVDFVDGWLMCLLWLIWILALGEFCLLGFVLVYCVSDCV